jgi:uncharacterized delta-60 repeat protein
MEVLEGRTLLAAAGDLDPTFGENGVVLTSFGGTSQNLSDVTVLSDGRILVAGQTQSPISVVGIRSFVARFLEDGRIDPTFGTNGVTYTPKTINSFLIPGPTLVPQADGKTLLLYRTEHNGQGTRSIMRLTLDGGVDTTFGGGDGVVVVSPNAATDVAVQGDGKIVYAGSQQIGSKWTSYLTRLDIDGSLDESFGANGTIWFRFDEDANASESASTAFLQPDGKILVKGGSHDGTGIRHAFARFHSDGAPDDSFGGNGAVVLDIRPTGSQRGATVLSNGKIVFATHTNLSDYGSALVQLLPDGSLDRSFSDDGIAEGLAIAGREGIVEQSDGRLLVAGTGDSDILVERYLPEGERDPRFGSGGWVKTDLRPGPEMWREKGNALALDGQGRVLVVSDVYETKTMAIVRYLPGPADATVRGTDGDDDIFVRVFDSGEPSGIELHVYVNADPDGEPSMVLLRDSFKDFQIEAGGGNDRITLRTPFSFPRSIISGGDGDDTINLTGVGTDNRQFVRGGAGDDTLAIDVSPIPSFVRRRIDYDGGAERDELVVRGTPDTNFFDVRTAYDGGSHTRVTVGDYVVTTPTWGAAGRVEAARLEGGAGDDMLTVNGNNSFDAVAIDAGDGDDALTLLERNDYELDISLGTDADDRDELYASGPGGRFNFRQDLSTVSPHLRAVFNTFVVNLHESQHVGSFEVFGDTDVVLARPGLTVRTDELVMSEQSRLQLGGGELVVDVPAAEWNAAAQLIEQLVREGRDGLGPGIHSGDAADGITGSAVAATPPGGGTGMIRVKRSYQGDANLDGVVNADDYFRIDRGFLDQPADPLYAHGDFNYDGRINADDYFLIDSAFLGQGAPLYSPADSGGLSPVFSATAIATDGTPAARKQQTRLLREAARVTVPTARRPRPRPAPKVRA